MLEIICCHLKQLSFGVCNGNCCFMLSRLRAGLNEEKKKKEKEKENIKW
jgi:hypothetical protein